MDLGRLDRHGCRVAGGRLIMAIVEQRRAARQGSAPAPTPPLTATELAAVIGTDPTRAGHLLATTWAMVARYAPAAPEAVHREAVTRTSGWLAEQPAAAVRSESVGDISSSYAPTHMSALRHSGAMALLSPWKVRRAGAI